MWSTLRWPFGILLFLKPGQVRAGRLKEGRFFAGLCRANCRLKLVKALTGIDADRLEEEKRRGITIDVDADLAPRVEDAIRKLISELLDRGQDGPE